MTDKDKWNDLVIKNGGEFLQSWGWGAFQEVLGRKIIRFYQEDLGLAQIIITQLPLNLSWAYIPRGPIFFNKEKTRELINKIIQTVPKNTVFINFELADDAELNLLKFKARQPLQTLILDLSQNENELLNHMQAKTRYNINLAQKKSLEFTAIDVDKFYRVLEKTSARQGFRTYPKNYFAKLAQTAKLFGISNNGQIISVGCFYTFGNTATYLHGGSDYEHRALMPPYLLHWEAVKYFKSQGLANYDFWGIDDARWPGVTRFKLGFGGEIKKYPGAYVKILKSFWFKIYQITKR